MNLRNIPWGTVAKVGIAVAGTLGLWEGVARDKVMPAKAASPAAPISVICEVKPQPCKCDIKLPQIIAKCGPIGE